MTDNTPMVPTEDELMELGHECELDAVAFGRAVLARGGRSYGAGEVDRADAVNLARNCLGAHNCVITKKGMRVLAEAVLLMDAALSTPQPAQAQAGAKPLTDEQKNAMWVAATIELPSPQSCYLRGMADAERTHGIGIKGGQHGTE